MYFVSKNLDRGTETSLTFIEEKFTAFNTPLIFGVVRFDVFHSLIYKTEWKGIYVTVNFNFFGIVF